MLGERPFNLPGPFGWIANIIGIVYVIITTVLFVFPPELPVTGTNMNYCIVAFAVVIIIATIQWFIDGRKNFHGPQIDLDLLKEGGVVAIDPTTSGTDDDKKLDI